jgi:hypothetical protein
MKTFLSIAAFFLFFGFANAQGSKVPAAVTTKFKTDYPNVNKVKWDTEGSNYEAEFKVNNVETSVLYDATGKVVETETEINVNDLPAAVTAYMNKNVAGKKISEASKIIDAAGKVTYEAEAGGTDYIFDEAGNFIKTEKD